MTTGRWGKRKLNAVSWMRNPLGEYFVFGEVGSGKDQVTITLAYRKTKPGIMRVYRRYRGYIDRLMNKVPRSL